MHPYLCLCVISNDLFLHYMLWLNSMRHYSLHERGFINVNSMCLVEEIIFGIIRWLKGDISCLINMSNKNFLSPGSRKHFCDEATFKQTISTSCFISSDQPIFLLFSPNDRQGRCTFLLEKSI